jgi:hypothetical protein
MRRAVPIVLVLFLAAACSPNSVLRPGPSPEAQADSLYWKAVSRLQAGAPAASADSAITWLDAYLAASPQVKHRAEATALRRLAAAAQQLARVEVALQQARSAPDTRPREAESKGRDEEAVKEIQRLKDELAKAQDELERIKKRLAAPKP